MDSAREEGADGEYHGARAKFDAALRGHAGDAVAFENQIGRLPLKQLQLLLGLERAADGELVEAPIGLRAGGAHRRTLAGVQCAELDAGEVRRRRHGPTEGVDFLHQMALADAADRWIAAHLPQGLDAMREQQGA